MYPLHRLWSNDNFPSLLSQTQYVPEAKYLSHTKPRHKNGFLK